ncbi:MAG TPA: hypothetical protein PLL10_00535 [Elusimicrobiales bacterium]|nr:hypothetical protein [Elusimicrobiales bacterium]
MSVYFALAAAALVVARSYIALERLGGRFQKWSLFVFGGGIAIIAVSHVIMKVEWHNAFRGLPALLVFLIVLYSARLFGRLRSSVAGSASDFAFWLLAVFSLLLLAKVILNVWLGHYAFALAVPGAFMLCIFFMREVPAILESPRGRSVVQVFLCGIMLLALVGFIRNSAFVYKAKTYQVAEGADAMFDYPPQYFSRGYAMNKTMEFVGRTLNESDSFAVLPGSAMLNYLARRVSPCKFIAFHEADLAFQDKNTASMARSLFTDPPAYVFLISSDWFHTDYGRVFYDKLGESYRQTALIGFKENGKIKTDHAILALSRVQN